MSGTSSSKVVRQETLALQDGEEVLARWTDDGWWYRGVTAGRGEGDDTYVVADATGYMEQVARDDIISDQEHKFDTIQV